MSDTTTGRGDLYLRDTKTLFVAQYAMQKKSNGTLGSCLDKRYGPDDNGRYSAKAIVLLDASKPTWASYVISDRLATRKISPFPRDNVVYHPLLCAECGIRVT